jgi:hypothetical protein
MIKQLKNKFEFIDIKIMEFHLDKLLKLKNINNIKFFLKDKNERT